MRYDEDARRRMRGYDRGYDDGWREGMARGRAPGMGAAAPFVPFGWDPMMRWGGWDPGMGFVPYADIPPVWGYGLADDGRYDHPYFRGREGREERYDRAFRERPVSPRESSTYGRGGDRALRAWARERGYRLEGPDDPGPRRR